MLLLLILKRGPVDVVDPDAGLLATRVDELTNAIATKMEQKEELEIQVGVSREEFLQKITEKNQTSNVKSEEQKQFVAAVRQLNEARTELEAAEIGFAEAKSELYQKRIDADAERSDIGKTQLTGLMIRKDHVVIMLDRSASMFSSNLVDILRYRVSSTAVQVTAPKWITAREVAKWAYRRLPQGAQYTFLTYSNQVINENGTVISETDSLTWHSRQADTIPFNLNVDKILPSGSTDLKTAFDAIRRLVPKPKQVVLITDGLPTVPGKTPLLRMGGCPRFPSKGTTIYLSPTCRWSIMNDARKFAISKLHRIPIDVVLLPLQGDSRSVQGYWSLSADSGGRLLSPAPGWPHI